MWGANRRRLEVQARRWSGCLLMVALVALGCGSQPIPLSAQAGTTFVLMVPQHIVPGFGRGWSGEHPPDPYAPDGPPLRGWGGVAGNSPDLSLEDLQRGELFIYAVNPNDATDFHKLPLAYITRLSPARTSAASLARTRVQQDPSYLITAEEDQANWAGQVIAFIDIPVAVPGNVYHIYTERAFRRILPVNKWDVEAWEFAWFTGGLPVQLRILPAEDPNGPGEFSAFLGANHNTWQGNEERLKTMVPYPELHIDLATVVAGPAIFRPAAAEITLDYPGGSLAIAGVSLGKNNPSAAIVRWEILPGTPPTECFDKQTLQIYLIDPDELTGKLRVAFHHKDPSTCPYRVGLIDFSIESWDFYNANGDPETDPTYAPTIDAEIR